jgi:hypothetical protein
MPALELDVDRLRTIVAWVTSAEPGLDSAPPWLAVLPTNVELTMVAAPWVRTPPPLFVAVLSAIVLASTRRVPRFSIPPPSVAELLRTVESTSVRDWLRATKTPPPLPLESLPPSSVTPLMVTRWEPTSTTRPLEPVYRRTVASGRPAPTIVRSFFLLMTSGWLSVYSPSRRRMVSPGLALFTAACKPLPGATSNTVDAPTGGDRLPTIEPEMAIVNAITSETSLRVEPLTPVPD